jgi:hypothetical protein
MTNRRKINDRNIGVGRNKRMVKLIQGVGEEMLKRMAFHSIVWLSAKTYGQKHIKKEKENYVKKMRSNIKVQKHQILVTKTL